MKRKDVVLVIGIIILIFLNFRTNSNLEKMKKDLTRDINDASRLIDELRRNINYDINEMMQEQEWIINKDYKILDIDKNFENAKVLINWSLRENYKDAQVSIVYGEKVEGTDDVAEWKKKEATKLNGLNYQVELDLSPKNNYAFIIESDSDEQIKNDNLMDLDLGFRVNNRVYIRESGWGYGPSNKELEWDVTIENDYLGVEGLKVKSIKANIYINDELIETKEIFSELDIKDDKQKEYITYSQKNIKDDNDKFIVEFDIEDRLGNIYKLRNEH